MFGFSSDESSSLGSTPRFVDPGDEAASDAVTNDAVEQPTTETVAMKAPERSAVRDQEKLAKHEVLRSRPATSTLSPADHKMFVSAADHVSVSPNSSRVRAKRFGACPTRIPHPLCFLWLLCRGDF